jgi:rhamnogalacturonyl hydrolase YesR
LHELLPDSASPVNEILQIVEPCVASPGTVFTKADGTANFAGVCWADELSRATGDSRYLELLVATADRFHPRQNDQLAASPLDPEFRVEDFFFAGTLLGRAFKVTGDAGYISAAIKFLLSADTQQDSGLWWHCKSSPFYWGRGNAFSALGFSELLTYTPEDYRGRDELLSRHLHHLEALRRNQDASSGMWRQVIDMPETYLEHSATSMIGYSLARGLRLRWLDDSWLPVAESAWQGVATRVGTDGALEHVCVGTGPQPDLLSYIDRPYTDGLDDRGGSMALWFAVEMAALRRQNQEAPPKRALS